MKIQYKIYKLDTIQVEPEYVSNWPYGNISVNPTILREIPQKDFDDVYTFESVFYAENKLKNMLKENTGEVYTIITEYSNN